MHEASCYVDRLGSYGGLDVGKKEVREQAAVVH
jgi:hypothetical protein